MPTRYTHVIVLDFEATCDNGPPPDPQEIIEFPSVLLSVAEGFEPVDEFTSFVRPLHHPELTPFCRELTSIQQHEVDRAPPFPEVFEAHMRWLDGHGLDADSGLIVTCGDWDLQRMLPAQCRVCEPPVQRMRPIYTRWLNLKRLFCRKRGVRRAPGMKGMLQKMGMELQGRHHRGIDDCRNIARLVRALARPDEELGPLSTLSASGYPPITLRLELDGRTESVELQKRKIPTLYGLACQAFRCNVLEIRRADGELLGEDAQLLELEPGEALTLSV